MTCITEASAKSNTRDRPCRQRQLADSDCSITTRSHPHTASAETRHTLATQAINRGMRLEAIAALPGHRKMEMTLIYARIANRVVADEYAQVSAKIDALYGQPPALPADYETTGMARLRREAHARMLGGVRLRDLRLLPHRHRVPAHPGPPARPRPRPRPG